MAVSLASAVAVAAAVIQPSVLCGYAAALRPGPSRTPGEISGLVGGGEGGAGPPGTGRSGSRLRSVMGDKRSAAVQAEADGAGAVTALRSFGVPSWNVICWNATEPSPCPALRSAYDQHAAVGVHSEVGCAFSHWRQLYCSVFT